MALEARFRWISHALSHVNERLGSAEGQRFFIEEEVEAITRRKFDGRAFHINPFADAIRRAMYQVSLIKSFLEYCLGATGGSPEKEHRYRLRFQTLEDFEHMLDDDDFPYPHVVW